MTDVQVVAQLSNGKQYMLIQAVCKAALEANTRDGQTRVRWEGVWCEEIPGGSGTGPQLTENLNKGTCPTTFSVARSKKKVNRNE